MAFLADTSGIFALVNRRDRHHQAARRWFASAAGSETLVITQPLLTEAWRLIHAKIGAHQADTFWESVLGGLFIPIDLEITDLRMAFEIRKKYADSGLDFVDATCLAVCERHYIRQVFTFDRAHFGIYRPTFTEFLELVPEM